MKSEKRSAAEATPVNPPRCACTAAGRVGTPTPLGNSQCPAICTFTMFKFLLLKHASANLRVILVTSSGLPDMRVFTKVSFDRYQTINLPRKCVVYRSARGLPPLPPNGVPFGALYGSFSFFWFKKHCSTNQFTK